MRSVGAFVFSYDDSGAGPRPGKMRVLFMGTPEFALGSLRALDSSEKIDVVAVVTRPDAVSGRGKQPVPSPVKAYALEHGIPVVETKTLRAPEVQEQIAGFEPDLIAVTAYGAIIPDEVLAIPELGCVNVHASLLPRWRGAAPMQRALLAGDARVGYSIMKIGHELDAGPWVVQSSIEPGEHTYPEVSDRLSKMGGQSLVEVLQAWWDGHAPDWNVQDPEMATYADKLDKSELLLDPALSATDNARRVFASSDAAPARCVVAGRGVRVTHAHVPARGEDAPRLSSGEVGVVGKRLYLGCANGAIEVVEVRPDGKREMTAADFVAGLRGGRDARWEAVA